MTKVIFLDGKGRTHTRCVRSEQVAHCIDLHERQGLQYLDEEVV